MEHTTNIVALAASLARLPGFGGIQCGDLEPLGNKGVSHSHWRITGRQLVVRVARFHQWGFTPEAALVYEATAFERASASNHTPDLIAKISCCKALPTGALVVLEIPGRAPRLPDDMIAIAHALASLHTLPLPPRVKRSPLLVHDNAFANTLAVIETQAESLSHANLTHASLSAIGEELEWARAEVDRTECSPSSLTLAGTDTHPGNFLIDETGKAWFVDLEKLLYGAAAIDLAHATLPTSTGWDSECAKELSRDDVRRFHRTYFEQIGPQGTADGLPVLAKFRRLTWLRTITWFARWRAEWSKSRPIARTQTARHVTAHVNACLTPTSIARQRLEWLGSTSTDLI